MFPLQTHFSHIFITSFLKWEVLTGNQILSMNFLVESNTSKTLIFYMLLMNRGRSRTAATTNVELSVVTINGFQPFDECNKLNPNMRSSNSYNTFHNLLLSKKIQY